MKSVKILRDNWYMREATEPPGQGMACSMPSVVQEVLLEHQLLKADVLETGRAEDCRWVSEKDWIFETRFSKPAGTGRSYLEFRGLDAVVDIYINGEKVYRHESMYMPCQVDLTGKLQDENTLMLHFFSPFHVAECLELPERYKNKIRPLDLVRKAHMDYSPHGGVIPYFTPIGVYDEIRLIQVDESEITYADMETDLDRHYERGVLRLTLHRTWAKEVSAKLRIYAPDGFLEAEADCAVWKREEQGGAACSFAVAVDSPMLWWPRNYGGQPLYRVEIGLWKEGRKLDVVTRTIGFRKIEVIGDMRFRINGREIKLWGSAITPMWGCSHKWIPERGRELLDFAVRGNMNALRLWGPGQPYHEDFYEYASKSGILIWQEFHTCGAYVPDLPAFKRSVMQEAETAIRRLKHFPCIFMWCGGNENFYMLDIFHPQEAEEIGFDLLRYELKDLAARMDPSRYYHASSPCGGRFPNEAVYGDNHGSRAAQCFLPGERHAHFFSENIRTFVPELKSLRRFIPEEQLWPEGYENSMPFGCSSPIPDSWKERTINHFEKKTGPYERFYDATDAASLIYRLNASAAYDIREIITKQRQGKPFYESAGERRCNGHLFWKLGCPWPQIYCAFIDYYMEPCMPYYMLRRCYAPVSISIDLEDHIYIWGVNDTAADFGGTVALEVCNLDSGHIVKEIRFPAGIAQGDSLILKSLDCMGQIPLRSVVHAALFDQDGAMVSEDFQYLISERRLPFGEAPLELRQDGNEILVRSQTFARCVELGGNEDGDEFGWKFEDNYFDMMPGQERRVRVYGGHSGGIITAKAHYAQKAYQMEWKWSEAEKD